MGLGLVILFHILVVWALVSGLARKAMEVVIKPLETKIVEEVKPPPPPPDTPPPPPPKLLAPPPPFIPPPEVQVQQPAQQQP
ncbi:energy transducer TonB, partial [Undibacterium sp. JH2W]